MVFSAENALDVVVRVLIFSIGVPAAAFFALKVLYGLRRNGCAANRYLAWLSVSVMCVALPVFAFADAFAHRHVTVLNVVPSERAQDARLQVSTERALPVTRFGNAPQAGPQTEPALGSRPLSLTAILSAFAALWVLGALLLLVRLVCRLQLALALKRGFPAALQRQISRGATVLYSDDVLSPVAIGYFRPAILLPRTLENPQLGVIRHHALEHEIAHLRRYDDLTALAHQFCAALAWMNPIVWFIGSCLETEREKACDDAVVLQTHAAREYGRSLLSLCGESVFSRPVHVLALFESPQRLTDRIEALMTKRPRSVQPQGRAAAFALAVIAAQATIAAIVIPGFAIAASLRVVDLPALSSPRADHVAALLNDGSVLIAGGMLENHEFLKSAELYVPTTRRFEPVGDMHEDRVGAASVTLPNGKVLVAGGWTGSGLTRSTELYDPSTRAFLAGPPMLAARGSATATVLHDGRVLVAGGWAPGTNHFNQCAELYDWRANRFIEAGTMREARGEQTATLLQDGTVLLAGGTGEGNVALRSAEIFDPQTMHFTPAGAMTQPRTKHSATLLPDGRVLVAGGGADYTWKHVQNSAEIYDPRTRTFAAIDGMTEPRFKDSQSTVTLADGSVLFAGGAESLERFDPRKARFVTLNGRSAIARHFGTATVLRDGSVLLAGGYGNDARTSSSSQLVVLR